MSFDNETNVKRVTKINEIVDLLQKSATSNKATSDEIWSVMSPALDAISFLCGAETTSPAVEPEEKGSSPSVQHATDVCAKVHKSPLKMCIKQAAEEADLADLTIAMAVYINRIDDVLRG